MDAPYQVCRTCKARLVLTAKYWYCNSASKTGFSLHCKVCDRKYHQDRKHGKATHRGNRKKPEVIHYSNEKFGNFEAAALKDKRETLSQSIISIYQEI